MGPSLSRKKRMKAVKLAGFSGLKTNTGGGGAKGT